MNFFIIALFGVLLLSCDIGTGGTSGAGAQVVLSLPTVACEKINECEGFDQASCVNSFFILDNIDSEIGLTPGDYVDFNAVRRDVADELIIEDAAASLICLDELRNLSCALPAVDAAYDPILINPLQNLEGMLPVSCANIF